MCACNAYVEAACVQDTGLLNKFSLSQVAAWCRRAGNHLTLEADNETRWCATRAEEAAGYVQPPIEGASRGSYPVVFEGGDTGGGGWHLSAPELEGK